MTILEIKNRELTLRPTDSKKHELLWILNKGDLMELADERIVVTGGAGFLGSFVCECLSRKGVKTVLVPRKQDYDLTAEKNVERLYKDFRPSIVIHLAAVVGGIAFNEKRPADLFYDNLVMGAELLEYARRNNVKKFVNVGTICSYPSEIDLPFKESDLWKGYPEESNAPYGLAKRMLLEQARTYRDQYGFNSIYLLPANLYGPRENFDLETSHVIPALVRKFFEAKINDRRTVKLWGTGEATRDFLFVEDAASAIVKATKELNRTSPVNLGTGTEISIKNLARKLKTIIGFSGNIKWDSNQPTGQKRRRVDTTRALQYFDWEASTPLDEGLKRTVEWYKSTRDRILSQPGGTGFQRQEQLPDMIRTSP